MDFSTVLAKVAAGEELSPEEKQLFFGAVHRYLRQVGGRFPSGIDAHWLAVRGRYFAGAPHVPEAAKAVTDYLGQLAAAPEERIPETSKAAPPPAASPKPTPPAASKPAAMKEANDGAKSGDN